MKRAVYSAFALTATLLIGQSRVYGQASLGSESTYQGQLKDAGLPADGDYDFVFRLFDAATDGVQVGSDFPVDDWPVSDGLFTVQVDFGDGAFNSEARWLEVAVRPWDSNDPHTVLSPRQPVTAAPVALYALDGPGSGGYWTANGDDIYNNNAGGVGIGTTTSPYSMLDVRSTEGRHGIMSEVPWIAVWAHRASTTGTYPAIHGECDSEDLDGSAIRGIITSTSPGMHSAGVRGINNGTGGDGIGVYGSQDGGGWGVLGTTLDGIGVQGSSDEGYGVFGASGGAGGIGVYGFTTGADSTGVFGISLGEGGYAGYFNGRGCFMGDVGIHVQDPQAALDVLSYVDQPAIQGVTDSGSYGATGICGIVSDTSPGGYSAGVLGQNNGTGGNGIGVYGRQDGSGWGVYGYTPSGRGVYGHSGDGWGVYGRCDAIDWSGIGVYGSHAGYGVGVHGVSANGIGVYGTSTNGTYAGWFDGTVRVDVLEISGADVAEKFPVSDDLADAQPGTVMEIDPENPGKLRIARGAYNRRVAGVVSGAGNIPTGTILGNLPGSEDAPAIALNGRVWVYGDATEQPIVPGDLLTTAARPGHAMKVTDYEKAQGAVLGKAMTGLEEGTGLVLVLVNLQ